MGRLSSGLLSLFQATLGFHSAEPWDNWDFGNSVCRYSAVYGVAGLGNVKVLRINLVLGVLFLTLPTCGDIVDLVFTYFAYRSNPVYWFLNEAAFSFKMDVITHGYLFAALNAMAHNLMIACPLLGTCGISVCVAHRFRFALAERVCLVFAAIGSGAIFALHVFGGLSWSLLFWHLVHAHFTLKLISLWFSVCGHGLISS